MNLFKEDYYDKSALHLACSHDALESIAVLLKKLTEPAQLVGNKRFLIGHIESCLRSGGNEQFRRVINAMLHAAKQKAESFLEPDITERLTKVSQELECLGFKSIDDITKKIEQLEKGKE